MRKTYILEGLDCANCGTKIERKVSKIKGVEDANVDFMSSKMHIEITEENEELIKEIEASVKKIDKHIVMKGI